eukprot:5293893-Prymnesium_polylepis.2
MMRIGFRPAPTAYSMIIMSSSTAHSWRPSCSAPPPPPEEGGSDAVLPSSSAIDKSCLLYTSDAADDM